MEQILKFFDGKKTYIGILVSGVLGIIGMTDEVHTGTNEAYAQLAGLVLGTALAGYGRFKATQVSPKKKRKTRTKKVTVNA